MSHVAIDFETYYDKEVSIKTLGAYTYLQHPKCEPYLVTIYDGEQEFTGHPRDFDWTSLEGRTIVSHNAAFDKLVYDRLVELGWADAFNSEEWNCTANLAVYLRAQRSLKGAIKDLYGMAVSKDYRKLALGKTADQMKADGSWAQIVESNVVDTKWTWTLWNDHAHKWPEHERRLSVMTWQQCHRGMPIDRKLVEQGIKVMTMKRAEASKLVPWPASEESGTASIDEFKKHCQALGVTPPESTGEDEESTKEWEKAHQGTKPLSWLLAMRDWRKCNMLLKRLQTLQTRLTSDGRFTYAQKYFGAHTGRWAGGSSSESGGTGEQGFNPQNFPKEPLHGVDLRKCVIASKGRKLIIADAAQIEPRCLHWCAGDWDKLELIRGGMSVYEVHARATMGWNGGVMKYEDKKGYRIAKDRVLGLGYGCGHVKFRVYTKVNSGVDMTLQESKAMVTDFRNKEKNIVRLWNKLQNEFVDSISHPEMVDLGNGATVPAYIIELPSGRNLTYFNPRMERKANVFGKSKAKKVDEDNLRAADFKMDYCASNAISGRLTFYYGGLLTENLIQATARDVFGLMLIRLEDYYGDRARILFTSHDEVILDCTKDVDPREVEEIMGQDVPWMEGCPFAAEAEESNHYKK